MGLVKPRCASRMATSTTFVSAKISCQRPTLTPQTGNALSMLDRHLIKAYHLYLYRTSIFRFMYCSGRGGTECCWTVTSVVRLQGEDVGRPQGRKEVGIGAPRDARGAVHHPAEPEPGAEEAAKLGVSQGVCGQKRTPPIPSSHCRPCPAFSSPMPLRSSALKLSPHWRDGTLTAGGGATGQTKDWLDPNFKPGARTPPGGTPPPPPKRGWPFG